jgi:hypothetical protein
MKSVPSVTGTLTSLAAVCAVVSACSGTTAGAGRPPASAPTPSTHAVGAAASASLGTGAAANFDVCAALPVAMVAQITGTAFTTAETSSTEGVIFECDYSDAGSDLLQISVTTTGGGIGLDSDVSALTTAGFPPNPVSGVGDKAFSEPDPKGNAGSVGASSFASYGALFGDTYIQIGGLTYVTPDQGKQIVEQLHGKL